MWSSLNPHNLSVCLSVSPCLSVREYVFACCWAVNKCVMSPVDLSYRTSSSVILRALTGDFQCLVSQCCLTLTHLISVMDSLHLRHNGLELAARRINIYLSTHSLLFLLSTFIALEHATFIFCCSVLQTSTTNLIISFAGQITYSSGAHWKRKKQPVKIIVYSVS